MEKIKKTDEEWRKELTPEQYHVARQKGTEPAFTGKYWDNHDAGTYKCVCCGAELFDSAAKLNRAPDGPVFRRRSIPAKYAPKPTPAMACGASKPCALSAMHTWGMCFPTARALPAPASA